MDTLSYDRGSESLPLLEETIGACLERTTAQHGSREALIDVPTGRRWTYQELNADVDILACHLLASGIDRGDRVGLWATNCAEWTIVQFATAKIGAVLVNINPAYRTHELSFALRQSGCRLLIAEREVKGSSFVDMVDSVRAEVPELQDTVYLGTPEWSAFLHEPGSLRTEGLRRRMSALTPSDPINIQYTSGTTGFPKGATLSHRNILNNGYFVGVGCGYSYHDRVCIPVPFYHCFGMVMGNLGAMTHGAAMVIPSKTFDPVATLQAVSDERCTSLYGVPTMFIAELATADFAAYQLSSLRTGIMAGSPCPVEVMKRVINEMGCEQVTICYGMTETSPVSTQTKLDDDLQHRTSTVGVVHPHVEIKIVDPENGAVASRGATGELCTRGYSVMAGYWAEPDRTAEAIDTEGWMRTGDLATMDADGYVNIVGRIKDMVIRGGENVYPREIEEFLYTHPDIVDVQVVGVPDAKYGEELCAWVLARPNGALTEAAVRRFCDGKLAHFKIPRYVLFVEEFPMTVSGKVRKVEMRKLSIEQLGLESIANAPTA